MRIHLHPPHAVDKREENREFGMEGVSKKGSDVATDMRSGRAEKSEIECKHRQRGIERVQRKVKGCRGAEQKG